MNVFGLTITRRRQVQKQLPATLAGVNTRGGWFAMVREGFTGAWQRNIEIRFDSVLTYYAVYACVTLIASDIGKLRIKLVQKDKDGIWEEITSSAFSPVLRKPNRYQTRIKFFEQWMTSKLIHGNTYILKERDNRGVVVALYVLDPTRVRALVAPDGAVYYSLHGEELAGVRDGITVPASEIIHDTMVPLYHPLCGVSPLSACGLAATQGLRIQQNSTNFFANGSQPGGLLTAPGVISDEDRKEIQRVWESEYSGDNAGRVAVLGNGLKYEASAVNAVDAQLIEQLKWTAETVCSAYHVPPYMVGVAPAPAYNNVEALNLQYYTQCLQNPIESIELLLDEGLGLPTDYGTEFDLDDLLRMDTAAQIKAAAESIGGGGMSPNESRKRFLNLPPVRGGEVPYLQQQNYSLEALAKRDAKADPFVGAPAAPPPPVPAPRAVTTDETRRALVLAVEKAYDIG